MTVKDIKLYGDRVLIKPLKVFTYSTSQLRPKAQMPTGDKINLDEIPEVDPNEMEEIVTEVASDVQKALVIAIGDATTIPFKVGDTVLYHRKSGIMFELIKGTVLLKHWDVMGIVNK